MYIFGYIYIYIYIQIWLFACKLTYINLCTYLQVYNNVISVYWRLNQPIEQT